MNDHGHAASSRLTIAVVGAGSIGSTFAYYLARAGHDVTAVVRPGSARLQQLRRDGGVVLKNSDRAAVAVTDALDERTAYDLVVVTTLAYQAEALLPVLHRSAARSIHLMFNNFHPEAMRDAIGVDRCTFGMPFVAASLDSSGKLDATVSAGRKTLHGDRRWADLFTSAGVPSRYEAEMPLWLRCHVPLCLGFESIAWMAEQKHAGATWGQAMRVAHGVHGAFSLVKAQGTTLYPTSKKLLDALPDAVLAGMLWAFSRNRKFRELLATGANECRALVDEMQAAVPTDTAASRAVAAMRPS
ncbi:ketopantoate reductase family protein [Terriglobus sp.]|uniref:ketopantoate reductase family protein n=1 Tax=Terriglobus sp. TaxID=1889013 RepID=UPI003B00DB3E